MIVMMMMMMDDDDEEDEEEDDDDDDLVPDLPIATKETRKEHAWNIPLSSVKHRSVHQTKTVSRDHRTYFYYCQHNRRP